MKKHIDTVRFPLHLIGLILIFTVYKAQAQTGTYQKTDNTGATATIAVNGTGKRISISAFAWWHTNSGRHGAFAGSGTMEGNTATIRNDEGSGCEVRLLFKPENLDVEFHDCIAENLTEDFNGTYLKITDLTPGQYVIKRPKVLFYDSPDVNHPKKAYLIKGNRITIEVENITSGGWAFINYVNEAGKSTSGYMRLADIR